MTLPVRDRRLCAWLWLASFVGVSLLTRWLSLAVEILDVDEAAHVVGSWVLLDGGRLYRDFADNKPPLLYVYYALAQLPLGRGLFPVHLFTALVTVPLTALAASAVFRHDRRGVAAGFLHLLYGSAFLAHDMLAANAELVLLLPAAWAAALIADGRRAQRGGPMLLAGLLLGVATLVKQQAALWVPALAWPALAASQRGRLGRGRIPIAALALGSLAPIAAAGLAFASSGTARDLVYWTLLRNVVYATSPVSTREALERAAGSLLPWLLATAPLWWAWRKSRPLLDAHLRRLLDALLVLGLLPAFAGLRFFPHYLVPAGWVLAVGAAPAVAERVARPLRRSGLLLVAVTLALAVGFQVANAVLYLGGGRVYRETDPVYRATAERLSRDACFPGSRLFVWGWAPPFYYYAGLQGSRPASRFVAMAQAVLTGYVPGRLAGVRPRDPGEAEPAPGHWDWLMHDLEASRATYILDTAPAAIYRWDRYPLRDYPRLEGYLRERYELIDTVDGVRVFRRLGCVAGRRAGE